MKTMWYQSGNHVSKKVIEKVAKATAWGSYFETEAVAIKSAMESVTRRRDDLQRQADRQQDSLNELIIRMGGLK